MSDDDELPEDYEELGEEWDEDELDPDLDETEDEEIDQETETETEAPAAPVAEGPGKTDRAETEVIPEPIPGNAQGPDGIDLRKLYWKS